MEGEAYPDDWLHHLDSNSNGTSAGLRSQVPFRCSTGNGIISRTFWKGNIRFTLREGDVLGKVGGR